MQLEYRMLRIAHSCVCRKRGRERVKGGRERDQELFRGSWEGKGGKDERKHPCHRD